MSSELSASDLMAFIASVKKSAKQKKQSAKRKAPEAEEDIIEEASFGASEPKIDDTIPREKKPKITLDKAKHAKKGKKIPDEDKDEGGGHGVDAHRAPKDPQPHGDRKGKGGDLLIGAHGAQLGQLLARLPGTGQVGEGRGGRREAGLAGQAGRRRRRPAICDGVVKRILVRCHAKLLTYAMLLVKG